MGKYREQIERLVARYFRDSESTEDIYDLIGKILIETCKGKKFVVWGAGEHTEAMFKYFPREMKETKCIIDNNIILQDTSKFGKKIIAPQELKQMRDIEVVVISSYSGAKAIEKNIRELDIAAKVVNIYTLLEEIKGIKIDGAFYGTKSIYSQINFHINLYETETNNSEEILEKIIYLYLLIRDFKNALFYLKRYIELDFARKEEMIELLKSLEQILAEVKMKTQSQKEEHILMLYIDALRYKDVFGEDNHMHFLNQIAQDGICFEKMYSTSICTYETMVSALTNKMPLDKEIEDIRVVDIEQVEFLKHALTKGYKINVYGMCQWDIVRGEGVNHITGNYASEVLWNMISNLAENEDEKSINIVYIWQETHPPHLGGEHSNGIVPHVTPFSANAPNEQNQQRYTIQYQEAIAYADKQIEYYFNFLSNDIKKVIFSDHGQIIEQATGRLKDLGTRAGWHTERYHVPFIISGGNIQANTLKELYTLGQINEIMSHIIEGIQFIQDRDIIEVQFPPFHNIMIREQYIENELGDFIDGFKIFLSEKNKVVVTGNNKIFVYDNSDEEVQIRSVEQIQDVIKYFQDRHINLSYL